MGNFKVYTTFNKYLGQAAPCVLSISRVHKGKEHVVKPHAFIACKHHMQLCVTILVDIETHNLWPLHMSKYCEGVVFWTTFLHIHAAIGSTIVYSNRFRDYGNNLQLG